MFTLIKMQYKWKSDDVPVLYDREKRIIRPITEILFVDKTINHKDFVDILEIKNPMNVNEKLLT